jgi:hypothetical protein
MANDEWRVEVQLDDPEHGFPLSERLRALDLDEEVADRLGDRVIVTRDGPRLFVYTQSDEAAREAARIVQELAAEDELTADTRVRRWNPVDRFWQDPNEPLTREPETSPPDLSEEVEEEGVPHPLFTFIEGHEPRFMRDLGL